MQNPIPSERPPLDAPWYGIGPVSAFTRFFRKYADFSGRAGRAEYWWVTLWSLLIGLVSTAIGAVAGSDPEQQALVSEVLSWVWGAATLVPALALTTRRLHDTGRSGWLQLLTLVPVVGWILLIVWYCSRARPEGARFDRHR